MAALGPVESLDFGQDIDPNASPVGSIDTNTTPDTEFSPPDSPVLQSGPPKDKRTLAKQKLATLTLEEKVRCPVEPQTERPQRANMQQVSLLTAADFWRTKSIPSKNIPAVKTSDGPNGARGGIFVGGTKVSFPGIHCLGDDLRTALTVDAGGALPLRRLAGGDVEQGHTLPGRPAPGRRGQGPVRQRPPRAHRLHAQTPAGREEL